ncbi:MAG TPA: hypothetical protein VH560_18535 [Polyangia bacterium]|nr:hypothetical protein [Polyangia bacterium]
MTPLRRTVSSVLALALSWSSLAFAAPAVVKRATEARSAPFEVAPVLSALVSGAKLSADRTADNGWRRVALPDGRFAFVRDSDVEVDLSSPESTPPVPSPAAAAPATTRAPEIVQPLSKPAAGGAPTYVTSLDQLAEVTQADPVVSARANDLANRRLLSTGAITVGVVGGALLHVLAESALRTTSCADDGFGDKVCTHANNRTVDLIGISMIVVGPMLGWLLRPTHDDETEIVNQWNARHPLHPMLDGAAITAP